MSDYTDTIQTMYIAYFNRPAESAGLDFWLAEVAGSTDVAAAMAILVAGFEESAEYAALSAADKASIDTTAVTAAEVAGANAYTTAAGMGYSDSSHSALASAWLEAGDYSGASLDAAMVELSGAQPEPTEGQTYYLSNLPNTPDTPENLGHTDFGDTYIARGNNSLTNADIIDGGLGDDTVKVMLDNFETAESPMLISIENLSMQAQSVTGSSGDNDVDMGARLNGDFREPNIDAGDMADTKKFINYESRADLVVEHIVKNSPDVTVRLESVDAGDVDTSMYYDNITNIQAAPSGSRLTLELINLVEVEKGKSGLEDNKYTSFTIKIDDDPQKFEIDNTTTNYAKLATQITQALADKGYTSITAKESAPYNVFSPDTGLLIGSVQAIILTNTGPEKLVPVGWNTDSTDQALNGYKANITTTPPIAAAASLTQTNLELDNVGRGSKSGDVVLGNDSVGNYSDSAGIQQFNVEVDRTSWISHLSSTNNTLERVDLVNSTGSTGDLTIGNGPFRSAGTEMFTPIAADVGLTDVRVVDGTSYKGDISINAAITDQSVEKYLNPIDADVLGKESTDDLSFSYALGLGDDTLLLDLDADVTVDSDFALAMKTGGGDDTVVFTLNGSPLSSPLSNANWYNSQKANSAISINTGAGDDVVKTPNMAGGDVTISTGSGNDVAYTDNTGSLRIGDISEQQLLTFGRTGDLDTQGPVTVSIGGQTFTTAALATGAGPTAVRDAAFAAISAWNFEASVVSFVATTGPETITVGGLSLHTTGVETAFAIATAFQSGSTAGLVSGGTFSGALTGFTPSAVALGAVITYTSTSWTGMDTENLVATSNGVNIVTSTDESHLPPGFNVVKTGVNGITLTYPAGTGDVVNAVISDMATDSVLVASVLDNPSVGGNFATTAAKETVTVTFVPAADTQTIIINGVTITLSDTDNNGTVSIYEAAKQVSAASFTDWKVVSANTSLGVVNFESTSAKNEIDLAVTGTAPAPTILSVQGVDAIAAVAATTAAQSTITMSGAEMSGTVTFGIDVNGDGTVTSAEQFPVAISAGEAGSVAAQVATGINAIPGLTAAQGAAGVTIDDVVITYDSNVVLGGAAPAAITMTDGALMSSSVTETVKGLEGIAQTPTDINGILNVNTTKAIWTANNVGGNDVINQLTTSATNSFSGIKGQLRVDFTPEIVNSVQDNGVTSVWVNIDYNSSSLRTSSMDIRQAVKTAVANDNELSKLLVVKDGPSDTFIIESLIDGVMDANDLNIEFRAPLASTDAPIAGRLQVTPSDIVNAANADNGAAGFDATTANSAYTEVFAQDAAGANLIGEESTAGSSDNWINLGTGNDVAVLSTSVNSSETVTFRDDFNLDTIVYFNTASDATPGNDKLNFTSYLDRTDKANDGNTAADNAIAVDNNTVLDAINNISIVSAGALNVQPVITNGDLTATTTLTGLVLATHVDDSHVADVYTAQATGAAANATLTLVGTIDLVDVNIASLTAADFTAV